MTGNQIPRGGRAKLDMVEGDLKVGNKSRIYAADGKRVRVTGNAIFEGDCHIECNFECNSLSVKHGGTLRVNGDITVQDLLDVQHSVYASGMIDAGEIDVGGRVNANSIRCKDRIRVGGQLTVKDNIEAKQLGVGGQASAGGTVKLQDLAVGGVAEIGGGSILGKIQVGGKFEARGPLEFGELQVYGRIDLAPISKGNKISTYGKLTAGGDLDCRELELMGRAEINGDCRTERVESSGKLSISGSLEATVDARIWGQTDIASEVKGNDIRIAGHLKAKKVSATNEVELAGYLGAESLRARTVLIRGGSRCEAVVVGEKVEVGRSYDIVSNWGASFAGQTPMFRLIGKETSVGDVYANTETLGMACRCGKIFGDSVSFEEGMTAEEITYTKEVSGPLEKVYINKPFPKKVDHLPDTPF